MIASAAAGDATIEVFLIFQNCDNFNHRGRVVPCLEQILGAQTVRLELHTPAKTTQAGLRPNGSHLADLRPSVTTPGCHCGNKAANLSSSVSKPAPGLLLDCVSGRDMTNLVGNNGSKLGFSIDEGQQPAIDVNVTTRQSHRIDSRTVDNRIGIFKVWAMTCCCHAISHFSDVSQQRLVLIYRLAGQNLCVFFSAHFFLTGL